MDREQLISELMRSMYHGGHHRGNEHKSRHSMWFTLYYLYEHQDTVVTPSDLRDKLDVTTARITALLNDLEEEKLIRRAPIAEDLRRISITLTENGLQTIQEHNDRRRESIIHLIDSVGEEDAAAYARVLFAIKQQRKQSDGRHH